MSISHSNWDNNKDESSHNETLFSISAAQKYRKECDF